MTPTPDIIKYAKASALKWGVPASVSIAQWALESGWGAKMSGKNNPFGIKGTPQNGTAVVTHEQVHGERVLQTCWFRNFDSLADAFDYHAKLLATGTPYKAAMAALPNLTRFISLMAVKYATGSDYAELLWKIINGNNLTQYDGGHA